MKSNIIMLMMIICAIQIKSQNIYSLEDCRKAALENNKEQKIADEEISIAEYKKKAAFTKYLPDISIKGSYMRNQKEMSLIGEDLFLPIGTVTSEGTFGFRQDQINNKWTMVNGQPVPLDANGQPFNPKNNPEKILWKDYTTIPKEDLTFDTRNVYIGALNLMQPIFMGGKIIAYNKISKINKELAMSKAETHRQSVILDTDESYWKIVSLNSKKKAVEGLIDLLKKMENDVTALNENGMATKADLLSVMVKKNEAEMTLLKVDNGISLSKMLLAQICGLPIEEEFTLEDENISNIPINETDSINIEEAVSNRGEVKSLNYAKELYSQKENVVRAEMLPTVALTANYIAMNPNVVNGFKNKFDLSWNVGVVVNIPLLHWGESIYNLKAAKGETNIATYKLEEVREKIELQINQSEFRQKESVKKLNLAISNMERANENLKYATISFEEGVIPTSNLLEAQTAWLAAYSDKIDAEIEAKMSEIYLQKAIGTLGK